jgi:phosphopantetheinyl transferase
MKIVGESADSPVIVRRGEVAVWWCDLDARSPLSAAVLSQDERQHADGFATALLTDRYRQAHVWLRHLLGQALERDPATVELVRCPCVRCGQAHGKPALGLPNGGMEFNLSRTGPLAGVVLGYKMRLGIDIERMQPGDALEDIAGTFLSQFEADEIDTLAPEDRPLARLGQWVRKEALLKATGEGLNTDPRTVILPTGRPTLGTERCVERHGASWVLIDLITDDAVAAVAVTPRPALLRWTRHRAAEASGPLEVT